MTKSILAGWAALLGIAYLVERPTLGWTAQAIGASWFATVHLMFDCATLTAAGWVAGRLRREHAFQTALVFAVTLCFWDFGETLALNVPWLLRLAWNSFHDSRYFDSLLSSVETQVLLFACLAAGAGLSRPHEKPASILRS